MTRQLLMDVAHVLAHDHGSLLERIQLPVELLIIWQANDLVGHLGVEVKLFQRDCVHLCAQVVNEVSGLGELLLGD